MKVGDLVTLSAQGENTGYCWDAYGRVGIVVGKKKPRYASMCEPYEFNIAWIGLKTDHFKNSYRSNFGWWQRRLIKKAKVKK